MQTYLFYDLETTGLSKSFDQVLHFAAIRTDVNLKELQRYELKIKLNPDVIPAPQALLTHRMGIKEIAAGISEYDAIIQIHRWLNEPGTISLGYNTLGFDDEFLRFSFYRNLLTPYTHQFANQCSRMDIYPMAIMFFLFKNSVIRWPQKENKISLKLEDLNTANHFITGRAHHAMVDVEATLELARCFMQERDMWEYLQGSFNKQIDNGRTEGLKKDIALLVRGKAGAQANFQCPILFLGNHRHYKNQSIWLRLDNEELIQTTDTSIKETTRTINKKPGEPNFILPLTKNTMASERLMLAEKNLAWLQNNSELFEKIIAYHTEYTYPVFPNTDIDASLYLKDSNGNSNGFWSNEDMFFCDKFHAAPPAEKITALEKMRNPQLKLLAQRIIGRNFPSLLTAQHAQAFAEHMQRVRTRNEDETLIDYQGNKRLTPQAATAEIEKIRQEKSLTAEDEILLQDFLDYLRDK